MVMTACDRQFCRRTPEGAMSLASTCTGWPKNAATTFDFPHLRNAQMHMTLGTFKRCLVLNTPVNSVGLFIKFIVAPPNDTVSNPALKMWAVKRVRLVLGPLCSCSCLGCSLQVNDYQYKSVVFVVVESEIRVADFRQVARSFVS